MSLELARAHILGQERLRALVARHVTAAWEGLPGYDERDLARWLNAVVPAVHGAQRQAAALADAYLARELGRQPLGVAAADVTGAAVRNGTTPEEEWRRPFVNVWTALSNGATYTDAVGAGLSRAQELAATDMQLTMRGAVSLVGQADDGIHGFQRVTDGNACELCMIASTQRYHVSDLMPIHAHCGCSVEPLTEPSDGIINRDLYRELKADGAIDRITAQRQVGGYKRRAAENRQRATDWRREAASEADPTRRARLEERAGRYEQRAIAQDGQAASIEAGRAPTVTAAVREHGELGPVLVNADQHFTTAAQLAA